MGSQGSWKDTDAERMEADKWFRLWLVKGIEGPLGLVGIRAEVVVIEDIVGMDSGRTFQLIHREASWEPLGLLTDTNIGKD